MTDRCCGNCRFALAVHDAPPGTLLCVSHPETPGEPRLVACPG